MMDETTITLLPGQQVAFDRIKAFLTDDKDVFILKGYAGTGKTTLIRYIVNYLQDRKLYEILAPTGRAAKILRTKTNSGATIHSHIYSGDLTCIEIFNEDKSKKTFKYVFPIKAESTTLRTIIVDESSMVSDTEFEDEFFKFGTGRLLSDMLTYKRNCGIKKMIFIGDPAQLPPVGDSHSHALDENYFIERGYKTDCYELTEVVRQQSKSKILEEATKIRNLLNQTPKSRQNFTIESDGKEIIELSPSKIIRQYTNDFPIPELGNSIMICFSNRHAYELNKAARTVYFPNQNTVQPGDILLVNTNNRQLGLLNGDMVKVLEIGETEVHKNIPVSIEKEKRHIDLIFRNIKIISHSNDKNIETNCKIIENLLYSEGRNLSRWELRALYIDFCMRNSKDENSPKEGTREFKDKLEYDSFFNALRVKFGYAVTCHKSQGGEWDSIYVDYSGRCGLFDDALRWCYTATTRAKNKLFVINAPHITSMSKLKFSDFVKINKAPKDFWVQDETISTPYHASECRISLKLKYLGVAKALENTSFKISVVKSCSYLEKYEFSSDMGEVISIDAYYDGSGFFKILPVDSENGNRNLICKIFNETTEQPTEIKYVPSDDLMNSLWQTMTTVAHEIGIKIVNVIEEKDKYFVNYYLVTDARFAVVQFYFRGNTFSTAIPKSELGNEDEKMKMLIKTLQNVV